MTAKEIPVTVPTMPLARSRSRSGTSSVTHVESAMPRIWPATEPSRLTPTSAQNQGRPMSSRCASSTATNSSAATAKHAADTDVDSTIAECLRWVST